jgi:hypothetical protein
MPHARQIVPHGSVRSFYGTGSGWPETNVGRIAGSAETCDRSIEIDRTMRPRSPRMRETIVREMCRRPRVDGTCVMEPGTIASLF